MVIRAQKSGIKRVFVPASNARESSVVEGIEIYAVENVRQVIRFLMQCYKNVMRKEIK